MSAPAPLVVPPVELLPPLVEALPPLPAGLVPLPPEATDVPPLPHALVCDPAAPADEPLEFEGGLLEHAASNTASVQVIG